MQELHSSLIDIHVMSSENLVYDMCGRNNIPCFKEFIEFMTCLKTENVPNCYTQYSNLMKCLREHGYKNEE